MLINFSDLRAFLLTVEAVFRRQLYRPASEHYQRTWRLHNTVGVFITRQ